MEARVDVPPLAYDECVHREEASDKKGVAKRRDRDVRLHHS